MTQTLNAIELGLFSSRIEAVCDEMGAQLQQAAFSPNIRDRLDYSCAVFDAQGGLCAQAAHIPVHLGSMAYAMAGIVSRMDWQPGDMVILNDPYLGGTHLPDVTLIAPVFSEDGLMGFVANRAHHADIGAESPGSMPISRNLMEEGLLIPPGHILRQGVRDEALMQRITESSRNVQDAEGDVAAQISANQRGVTRLLELIEGMGAEDYLQGLLSLNDYGERLALSALSQIPDGEYHFSDVMDDDGLGNTDICIKANLKVVAGQVDVDFTGTAEQVHGNINCPLSVTAAGVFYAFRCLMPEQTPACAGTFRPIQLSAPEGSLLNAQRPAAVAAGNVETSTRVVDVVLGALAQAVPEMIPAASQGSMNNLAMGHSGDHAWGYYETIGGGMGAGRDGGGLSAVQTHMTNTRNTPIEVLEMRYPLRVNEYSVRHGSGGRGERKGGDGLIREYEFLGPAQVTLLTERRRYQPWGIKEGEPGLVGVNQLNDELLPPKCSRHLEAGDRLRIETPGGGGYGSPEQE
jgi:N-methylhydantoinase B